MSNQENKYLSTIGLTFPACEDELIAFNEQHEEFTYQLEADVMDPYKIAEKLKFEKSSKIIALSTSQSYFRRAVLAAKIADEYHTELTFGVVKFQKLVYLSEQVSKMKFVANYRKQAAGPMDNKFIHSIRKEFEKQKWFTVHQEKGPYRKWIFTPQHKIDNYKQYYSLYFSDSEDDIQFLIDTFRKWKTDKVELVATLFACWLELKINETLLNDTELVKGVYAWHKSKKKFSKEKIIASIRWMESKEIHPT